MNIKKAYFSISWAIFLVFSIILIDQSTKFCIKLHYPLTAYGQEPIVDWGFFKLLFVENKGMAMGAKFSDLIPFVSEDMAKLFLTLFRLCAVVFIFYWLWNTAKKRSSILLFWALILIFSGALGNIIDSVFYGVLFSHSYGQVATFLPQEGGYAPLFHGRVVDMIQFPLVTWVWPKWLPFVGGEKYTFFQYIFNIADTSISTGVGILIVFNKRIFGTKKPHRIK